MDIHFLTAALPFKHFIGPSGFQHLDGLVFCDRGQIKGDILHHLDKDTAKAEHEHGAELRVPGHAEDDLKAAFRHLLHVNPLDYRIRRVLANAKAHQLKGVFHLLA